MCLAEYFPILSLFTKYFTINPFSYSNNLVGYADSYAVSLLVLHYLALLLIELRPLSPLYLVKVQGHMVQGSKALEMRTHTWGVTGRDLDESHPVSSALFELYSETLWMSEWWILIYQNIVDSGILTKTKT